MAEEGKSPSNDETVEAMFQMYTSTNSHRETQEADSEWQQNNLEYDLRSTTWILEKVRASTVYAQNLYAAMCNREFMKIDIIVILKEERWSCSWRYAGGIVADMRQSGDYIDWYCSGIGNREMGYGLSGPEGEGWVSESIVTEEIKSDLEKLGWAVLAQDDTDQFI